MKVIDKILLEGIDLAIQFLEADGKDPDIITNCLTKINAFSIRNIPMKYEYSDLRVFHGLFDWLEKQTNQKLTEGNSLIELLQLRREVKLRVIMTK